MVYRERLTDPWHCSWCDFTHEEFEKVVDHENEEHGGKEGITVQELIQEKGVSDVE